LTASGHEPLVIAEGAAHASIRQRLRLTWINTGAQRQQ